MSCDLKINPLFMTIEKVSRIFTHIYIFVGNISNTSIKSILNKIEKKENIHMNEQKILQEYFGSVYKNWLNYYKKDKVDIHFINEMIEMNDTLHLIRKKIFYFLSNPSKNKYILPENQELWIKNENEEDEIIGVCYLQSKDEKINIKPSVKIKPSENKNFNKNNYKLNNSENNILIYDLIEYLGIKNNTIYVADAWEEYEYLKNKIKINENIKNNFFKKHFPYFKFEMNLNNTKKMYSLLKFKFEKNDIIQSYESKYQNNKSLLGDCNILYISLKSNQELTSLKKPTFIDLYQVFDYVREKKLGVELPFIKYGDESFQIPISLASVDALLQNKITKSTLDDWIGVQKITHKINGIIMKQYLKDYNNEQKYISMILRKNSELSFNVKFDLNDKATFYDLVGSIKNIKKLVDDINKNLISKKIELTQKIDPPDIEMKNNEIVLKKNTQLRFCNVFIPFKQNLSINFKSLYDFSQKFPDYLYDENKNLNSKNKQRFQTFIKLIYKKVSGFIPMSKIIYEIDKLKMSNTSDHHIIQIISKEYEKSSEEVEKYINEWKKKYASYSSSKIEPEFKLGVEIEITNTGIKLNNITRLYQVSIIYNFIKVFLLTFLKEKNIKSLKLQDNKLFNQNNFIEANNNSYYDYNQNNNSSNLDLLNINMLKNINSDLNNNNNDKSIISTNHLNNNNNSKMPGISNNSEIAPEIKLKCDDAIPEEDRCEDACNDTSYYLRRLQRYDKILFKYKKSNTTEQYSRICGTAQQRQPIILTSDPAENPKINRDAYTYSLKYSSKPEEYQRWYVCPEAWCPNCEIPLALKEIDVKSIQIRLKMEPNKRKKQGSGHCITAKCPYGDHQIMIRDMDGDYPTNMVYPGFIKQKRTPQGLCLPCCFAKPKNKDTEYKKCLGEEIENNDVKSSQLYILGKYSPIEKNRFGLLPIEVAKILNTQLETGYLDYKSGYLKKGIKHKNNQSFLSCLIDIISCENENKNIDENKFKKLLVEKINIDLFRTLHNGNLEIIFDDSEHNINALTNYKNYILNDKIHINHEFLWDYVQQDGILLKNGINIIIFEKNRLLCPIEINHFYDASKKTILLLKSNQGLKDYYEPIYYLEGSGKTFSKKCIYESSKIEIKNCLELSEKACESTFDINWLEVLKKNVKTQNLKIDNYSYQYEYELIYSVNELIKAVQNKKLDKSYLPELQYLDSMNKVFALKLRNGLYLPVKHSKLIKDVKYSIVNNLNQIELLDYKKCIIYTQQINKNTNIKFDIQHKILDNKESKYITALLNNNNRIIPVKKEKNKKDNLKISITKYFSDINEYLHNQILMNDDRIDKMNKKKFEDETFSRMRYELSIYLQQNKNIKDKILQIIHSDNQYNNNSLKISRKNMYIILNKIFKKLSSQNEKKINFFDYKTPNKRIPCYLRSLKKNKNDEASFSCDDDPHCIVHKNTCKLYIHKKNLVEIHKNIKNYDYYLSRLLDELLRYKIKREELLNNEIENIIHKNYVPENDKKYIIFQTYNVKSIEEKLKELFFDNQGIHMNLKKLYDQTSTKEYAFKKNLFLKEEYKNNNNNTDDLSQYWSIILGKDFKIKKNLSNVFQIFKIALKSHNNLYKNKNINVSNVKIHLIKYWSDKVKDSTNSNKTKIDIYEKYKEICGRIIKNIENYDQLMEFILSNEYKGCVIDFYILSQIYNINVVFLDKRIKNKNKGYQIIKALNNKYYILIYRALVEKEESYQIISNNKKYVFNLEDFSPKFIQNTLQIS